MLYPTPISKSLELVGPKPFKATLQPIPGDSSATATDPALPAYVEYQGDGNVTAGLVYVYGMQDDYKTLELLGTSVKGKVVIARYGSGWRGLKPKLEQDHGAIARAPMAFFDPKKMSKNGRLLPIEKMDEDTARAIVSWKLGQNG